MAKTERVLVTGAGGSIGSALCLRLAAGGSPVTALVRTAGRAEHLLKAGIPVVEADIRDRVALDRTLQDIDVVMHLAAMHTHVGASDRDFHEINVQGARNVVEVAQRRGVRRVVHVSTIGVHGDTGRAGVSEDSPYAPMDVYTRTKLEGELTVREVFDRSWGSDAS